MKRKNIKGGTFLKLIIAPSFNEKQYIKCARSYKVVAIYWSHFGHNFKTPHTPPPLYKGADLAMQ